MKTTSHSIRLLHYCLCAIVATITVSTTIAAPFQVAQNGKAVTAITIHPEASEQLADDAKDFAIQLGRITDATFEVTRSTKPAGIVLGTAAQFDNGSINSQLDTTSPLRREEYVIQSTKDTLWLIGANDDAVGHAIWDLLYRLGFRQVIPGERWEIVPTHRDLQIDLNTHESPDFKIRMIMPGGGLFDYDEQPVKEWRKRNRIGRSIQLAASHVYDKIVYRKREIFEEHPEFLALVDGKRAKLVRDGNKFCISNKQLRDVCIEWAKDYIEKYPHVDGVSMEPSDGGSGWCECEPCNALGTISDRVVFLANEVCNAINEGADRTYYVGLLAYSAHSPPPQTVEPDDRVIVFVAQGFIRGNYTSEELIEIWGKRDVIVGSRDYLGVLQWSWDMPGSGRSTRRSHYEKTLPRHYRKGVTLYIGESEGNWGPVGMGYYGVARVMWDVDEAEKVDELYADFLTKYFGPAAPTMRQFYDMINGDSDPLVSRDLVGRMYRLLETALSQTDDTSIRNRIVDLILYTRYVDMYMNLKMGEDDVAQQNYETLMKFIIRARKHLMVHTREIHRQLYRYDRRLKLPKEAYYRIPYDRNPWTDNTPITEAEAIDWLNEGIARNPLVTFETRTFSMDLKPATELGLTTQSIGEFGMGGRGSQVYFTYVSNTAKPITLQVTGGMISHYRDRGDVRITLHKQDEADDEVLDQARVPPTGEMQIVKLKAPQPGLYRIEMDDGGDCTKVECATDQPFTMLAKSGRVNNIANRWTLYFFVPKGTKTVGGFTDTNYGKVRDSDGKELYDFASMDGPGFFQVDVPEGQDGKLWQMLNCKGERLLMTVPPSMARSAGELLLPAEVIANH